MLIGTKKNIKLKAVNAYGEYNERAFQVVNQSAFPADTVIEEGIGYISTTKDSSQIPFKISRIDGNEIKLDYNHRLAGVNLNLDIEILDLRDATEKEISQGHVHDSEGHQY